MNRVNKQPNSASKSSVKVCLKQKSELVRKVRIPNVIKSEISASICRSVSKLKLKNSKQITSTDMVPSISKSVTSKDFRQFAEKCPCSEMSKFQEKMIRHKINAKNLQKLYPQIINDLMDATKKEYKQITHYACINLKLKDKYPVDGFHVKELKYKGKTENYGKYLMTRKQLEQQWILHDVVMRKVKEGCVKLLPNELFQLEIANVIELKELRSIFNENTELAYSILREISEEISSCLTNTERENSCSNGIKILAAATGIFSLHVGQCLAKTLKHVVQFSTCFNLRPYLKISVGIHDRLILEPTCEKVINVWLNFVNDLVACTSKLRLIEKTSMKTRQSRTIFSCLTFEFINVCKTNISDNIRKLFVPVEQYVAALGNDFQKISNAIKSFSYNSNYAGYKEGCTQMEYYKKYIYRIANTPDKEYFQIGPLIVKQYREHLSSSLQFIIDSIFNELSRQHFTEVQNICDSFNLIQMRATQIPVNTEELMEIGKFMAWVKNEQLASLTERVYALVEWLCAIINLGVLSEEHMLLNAKAVNWLNKIIPIIEQHTINYEQLKFEAEENLQKVIEDISVLAMDTYPLLSTLDEMDNIKSARKYLGGLVFQMNKIRDIQKKIEWINQEEIYLNFPQSNYPEFEDLKDYLFPFYHLLKVCLAVQRYISVWLDGQFDTLDYNRTNEKVEQLHEELLGIQKMYRNKLRQAEDENMPIRFKGTIDDPNILNWPVPLKICVNSIKILEDFEHSLKVMKIMCNKALCFRHWKAMSKIAGFNITPNAGTTLSKIMKLNLQEKMDDFEFISIGATRELELLNELNNLKLKWKNMKFDITKTIDNVLIVNNLQDIQLIVEDQLTKIVKMEESVFAKANEKELSFFHDKLLKFNLVLTSWTTVQNKYLQLFPIFVSSEIAALLPKENELFTFCKTVFIDYIEKMCNSCPVVDTLVSETSIEDDLRYCLKHFEEIMKGIENYMELQRLKFPRLYFLADNELIKLMTTSTYDVSSPFLVRIFPGIARVKLQNQQNHIVAVISSAGEELRLKHSISCVPGQETIPVFKLLLEEICESLKYKLNDCRKIFHKKPIEQLIEKYPQQVLQLAAYIFWTEKIEDALTLSHKIKLLLFKRTLTMHVAQKIDTLNHKQMTNLQRTIFRNLLLVDLNNQNLLNNMLEGTANIRMDSFQWQVQLKYRIQKTMCTVNWLDNNINYCWEYFGNDGCIIITPETERCYRTLLQAYHFYFHGLLRGKHEIGKREAIAALAKALGTFYFNYLCSEFSDASVLLAFLKGAAQCGCWLILDNFECLNLQVQSVLYQSFLSITEAKSTNRHTIYLDKTDVCFNPHCFITIVSRITRGELKMPESFKLLFRTFTFSIPDLQVFARLTLICQGCKNAVDLSKKISTCFTLLKNTLSNQSCELFNLRNLKSILAMFELEKRSVNERDSVVICRCIITRFSAGFSESDRILFEQILKEVFGDYGPMDDPAIADQQMQNSIKEICNEMHLQFNDVFKAKIYDLYEFLRQNHNVIVVGNCFSGKSTGLKISIKILEANNTSPISCHFINTKCVEYEELFGKFSISERTDGLLMKIFRKFAPQQSKTLIIFDGPLDPLWMEHIQNVLKERTVFLENGEIVGYNENINFVFETLDLRHCNPSMLFYCKTIYFPSNTINYSSIINKWLQNVKICCLDEYKSHIEMLLLWFLPPCLQTIEKLISNHYQPLLTLVKNTLIYFEIILDNAVSTENNKKDDDSKNLPTWIHATLLQAGALGFYNIIIDQNDQQTFDIFYKKLWRAQIDEYPYPNGLERLEVSVPQDGNLLDYFYLYKQRGAWKQWSDLLKHEKVSENLVVPTVNSLRCKFLLELHVKYEKNLLVVGPQCSGKSTIFHDYFHSSINGTEYEKSILLLRRSTTSKSLQELILSKLTRNIHRNYSSSPRNRWICFLEDLHVPLKENFPFEILRQHFDGNAWYDFNTLEECRMEASNFIASTTTANRSILNLPVRFSRHFNILAVNKCSDETVFRIYSQILVNVWKTSGFSADITSVANHIVSITLIVYKFVQDQFKANAAINRYYLYDLNAFSKVIRTCSCLRKDTYDANKKVYIKLWIHEILRVFGDRLDRNDKKTFHNQLEQIVKEHFTESIEEIFPNCESNLPLSRVFFGTSHDLHVENSLRHYDEVNFQQFSNMCIEYVKDYNSIFKFKLDLVLVDYSLVELIKISRLLALPGENALLLGLTGYGRQSLVKLASFMYKFNFVSPNFIANYNLDYWNEVFKNVLRDCGTNRKPCIFFANETYMVDENYLEIVDYYVREGQIIDLYSGDEKRNILERSRLSAQTTGNGYNMDISSHMAYCHFDKLCRDNLHIFIALNLNTEKLRRNLFVYPTLMRKLTLVQWEDWPNNALESIGLAWINEMNLSESLKNNVIKIGIYFHRNAQQLQEFNLSATPKAYIHMLKLFRSLIVIEQKHLSAKQTQFVEGLEKLAYASNQIVKMQNSLIDYGPQLEVMKQDAEETMEQISILTAEIETFSALIKADEHIVKDQAQIVQDLQLDCDSDFSQARPILDDAILALNTLKSADIILVKSMKNPPDAVKLVMASVCVIKEVKPEKVMDSNSGRKTIDYWSPSKRILSDVNLLQSLKDFDYNNIKGEIMIKLRRDYISHKDFKPAVVGKASSAAECLCKWIIAMDMYDRIAKGVAPKIAKLKQAEQEYADALEVLNRKKEQMQKMEIKLLKMHVELNEVKLKQRKLQKKVNECRKNLTGAQQLVNGFNDDKLKWSDIVEHLRKRYDQLSGDIILASVTIAYLSSLDHLSRERIKQQWKDYVRENYNIQLEQSDDFLIELGTAKETDNCKLPADPHIQAVRWISAIEEKNNIIVTKFTFSNWLQQLQDAVTCGKPILIKDTDGCIPLCVNYLLYGQVSTVDDDQLVQLDRHVLTIHPNFKLYIACLKLDPLYSSDMKSRLTLVNFRFTKEALTDKCLKILIDLEKTQLKKIRKDFLRESKENIEKQKNLEANILSTLCSCAPNILEDTVNIRKAEELKNLVRSVKDKQEKLQGTKTTIERVKLDYKTVAEYAANLFYCLQSFGNLNSTYQMSFDVFRNLYFTAILNAERYQRLDIRCQKLCEKFTEDVYIYVIRGVFEEHKLFFSFWLAVCCGKFKGEITDEQLLVFFGNTNDVEDHENPGISPQLWTDILKLEILQNFKGFPTHFVDHIDVWQDFFESGSKDLPIPWCTRLGNFDKLILWKTVKPRMFNKYIKDFIKVSIGERYLHIPLFDMQHIYNQSYNLSPILFIVPAGVNNLKILQSFAAIKQVSHKFAHVNLSGQEFKKTKKLLLELRNNGFWILIENCHLAENYLNDLEQLLETFTFENTHEDFRLFLNCEHTNGFPLELLQNCIKIVQEQAITLRQNLLQFYSYSPIFSDDFFYSCPGKQDIFPKLLYSLCYFHFVLQERSKISNWNCPYRFRETDLILSLKSLQHFINSDIFDEIYYLSGECNYNGHLEEDWEKTFLMEILHESFNDKVLDKNRFLFRGLTEYTLPERNDRHEHLKHINKLPMEDNPHSLYLTKGELLLHQAQSQKYFLDSGLKIIGKCNRWAMKTETTATLTMIEDILAILPEKVNRNNQNNEVISRELGLYENLLQTIFDSLVKLRNELNEQMGLSEDMKGFMRQFSQNSIPKIWRRRCYPTMLNVSHFIKEFCEKIKFMENIRDENYWLAAFFYPRALLVLIACNYSRITNISIANISLKYEICSDTDLIKECSICGLYLFGAKLSNKRSLIMLPESMIYDALPPIHIKPQSILNRIQNENQVNCYVFRVETGNSKENVDNFLITENYVTQISLDSELDVGFWIKKGLRIVCEIAS